MTKQASFTTFQHAIHEQGADTRDDELVIRGMRLSVQSMVQDALVSTMSAVGLLVA